MVFVLMLLGSMIVCEALFCGDLKRAGASAARGLRQQHDRVSSLIAASNARTSISDYRWE